MRSHERPSWMIHPPVLALSATRSHRRSRGPLARLWTSGATRAADGQRLARVCAGRVAGLSEQALGRGVLPSCNDTTACGGAASGALGVGVATSAAAWAAAWNGRRRHRSHRRKSWERRVGTSTASEGDFDSDLGDRRPQRDCVNAGRRRVYLLALSSPPLIEIMIPGPAPPGYTRQRRRELHARRRPRRRWPNSSCCSTRNRGRWTRSGCASSGRSAGTPYISAPQGLGGRRGRRRA